MIVNGKKTDFKPNESLSEFLKEKGYRIEVIAVELNGEIIAKESFDTTLLKEEDVMEVVTFMGGG
ncbi:MAG: sulfur carrier protein ThiS [Clostridiales bacterium]|nr:sulfur carrier protein ThiS [Clostridiales bacterium]